jgi:hypothetical protein
MSKVTNRVEKTLELYLPKYDSEEMAAEGLEDVWKIFSASIDKLLTRSKFIKWILLSYQSME